MKQLNNMITISFVIPIYNEEKRLKKTFKALENLRLPKGLKLEEVIFVDDGSTDRSLNLIKKFIGFSSLNTDIESKNRGTKQNPSTGSGQAQNYAERVRVVSYKQNKGKGYAVKQGMIASNPDYTLFFDADMSVPLSELKRFVPFMKKGVDIIISTRNNGQSTVIKHQPLYRQLLGRGFTFLSNAILGISFTDFTCGFKAFKKEAKDAVFSRAMIGRWGYDSEILFLSKRLGFEVKEIPVVWENDENSKVNLILDLPQSFIELILIRLFNLNIGFASKAVRILRYAYLSL